MAAAGAPECENKHGRPCRLFSTRRGITDPQGHRARAQQLAYAANTAPEVCGATLR